MLAMKFFIPICLLSLTTTHLYSSEILIIPMRPATKEEIQCKERMRHVKSVGIKHMGSTQNQDDLNQKFLQAVSAANPALVQLLINEGADPLSSNATGHNAWHCFAMINPQQEETLAVLHEATSPIISKGFRTQKSIQESMVKIAHILSQYPIPVFPTGNYFDSLPHRAKAHPHLRNFLLLAGTAQLKRSTLS